MNIKILCIVLLFLPVASFSQKFLSLDNKSVDTRKLDQNLTDLLKKARVTGLTMIVRSGEKEFTFKHGYANKAKKIALSDSAIFPSASLSKAVFAYLVCLLETEGVIDLKKPLYKYLEKPLPEVDTSNENLSFKALKGDLRYKEITAEMCLAHLTGFPNWRWMTKDFDYLENGEIRFLINPGKRFSYSGEGYQLLQYVIETITKKSLQTLASEKIFKPLGITNSSFVWKPSFEGRVINGHKSTPNEDTVEVMQRKLPYAAASLYTNADDYNKFLTHLIRQFNLGDSSVVKMWTPMTRIRSKTQTGYQSWVDTDAYEQIQLSYGLGWGIFQTPYGFAAFKEGHDNGLQHFSIVYPEAEISLVILSNSDNAESIFKEILERTIADQYTPVKWLRYEEY